MGTVWPSLTLISFSTPADGDGISASTLSVEISNSGSSRSILSPAFFSHFVMVRSKMLSPIGGMMTSTAMVISYALNACLYRGKAFFVPHAWHSLQRIYLVAAVEKRYVFHLRRASGVVELLRLQFIVILAGFHEFFQECAICDAHLGANGELRIVYTLCFSHVRMPASSALVF